MDDRRPAQAGHRTRPTGRLTPFVPGAKGKERARRNAGKSRSRGEFDTGTPRGGSIGLMRSTWEGRPIAGKRTAAAPGVKSAALRARSVQVTATIGVYVPLETLLFTVKRRLTVKRRTASHGTSRRVT